MGQAILTKSKIQKLTCSARALILQAINGLRGRETCDYIARPPLRHFQVMPTYAYAYNSYKKGKLRVYLIYKLKVSGARAPLGPTVDTPLTQSDNKLNYVNTAVKQLVTERWDSFVTISAWNSVDKCD